MKRIELLYGRGTKTASLDEELRVKVLHPQALPVKEDVAAEVRRAMEAPIGSERLSVLGRGRRDAVILACDLTRDVPDAVIIPMILDELNEAGIPDERIMIVIACGGHRPITREEAQERFGNGVLSRVRWVNHDASDKASLVCIGTSSYDTEIWINRLVAESDLIIGTGCIIPHVIAGYGGGRKLIVPGVAGEATIRRNHRPANVNTEGVGFCRVKGNVIHEELTEAARVAGLEFIVNVVWNGEGQLVKAVAGDMEAAWNHGVKVAARLYTVSVRGRYDILLTSGGGAPTDVNFYQAVRGMQVGVPLVRDGGAIILVAECTEGVGSDPLYTWLRDATCPKDILDRRDRGQFDIHGEHIACYLCDRVFPRMRVFLVSSISPKIVEEMMMTPAETVEEAMEGAVSHVGITKPRVVVNPYGAKVVPTLEGGR